MLIRPATLEDVAAIANVHVSSWRTTYRGLMPDEMLASLSVERREKFWIEVLSQDNRQGIDIVAEDDAGQIIGFASAGKQRDENLAYYDAEVYVIYLLESSQRQGIGRRLMAEIASRLKQAGYQRMALWVLKDNPAKHFYMATGGKYLHDKSINIGDVDLIESAYGWEDLTI